MLVLIIIVAILAIWNYLTLKRRREEAAVRREVLLIARHAEAKEARRERRGLIQEALISSVSYHPTAFALRHCCIEYNMNVQMHC